MTTVNHLPEVFGLKKGAEKFPLMVVLAVSYVCNARCPACPYTQSAIRQSYADAPFMAPSVFKTIANECGLHGAWLRLTGGGEPLLHEDIVDLIGYAKAVGAKVGLITNGSLLTAIRSKSLLYHGIDAIEISVDAADEATYAKVRVGLSFSRLVSQVQQLVEMRDNLGSRTKVIASIVNQKALEGKLQRAGDFWKGIVDEVQVRKYLTWGIGDKDQSGDPVPYLPDEPKRVPCPFPFERLNIDSRGKIEFCGFDIAGETDFGNVGKVSIGEVWRGSRFNAWRKLLLEGRYEEIPVCRRCPDWKYRSWNHNYWAVLEKADERRGQAR